MKVLYLAPEFPSAGSNAAQARAKALLPRLAKRVDLRTMAFPLDPKDRELEAEVDFVACDRAEVGALQLARTSVAGEIRAFSRFDTHSARDTLRNLLENFRPDIVHFDSIAMLAFLDQVRSANPPPKAVAHTHDAVSQLYKSVAFSGSVRSFMMYASEYLKIRRFEQTSLANCEAVVVDSEEDAQFLRGQGSKDVFTIPIGVDTKRFSPEGPMADLGSPSIVFSGSMGAEQSVDAAQFIVADIMPRVWAQHPRAQVYIVGNAPPKKVRALADDRIHVTGFVDDLTAYLRAADVYLCPLRLGSGMRTRVIEALACGARVVATPFAVRGLSKQDGADTPWRTGEDAKALADAILEVYESSGDKERRDAADYAAAHFSWDAVADMVAALYRRVDADGLHG